MLALSAVLMASQTVSAHAQDGAKEQLIEKLKCPDPGDCAPPALVRRGSKRGFAFRPLSDDSRKALEEKARAGAIPTADVEIYFELDKADLTPEGKGALVPLGAALADPRLAGAAFVLIGHTDARGPDAYNQTLSERRASAVRDYLIENFSIAPERLEAFGRGKSVLKVPADPFADANRRVQIINRSAMREDKND